MTLHRRLLPGEPGPGGYRPLRAAPGEPHVVRRREGAPELREGWQQRVAPLLVLAHLSDLHVMDHQSPARAEWLDRLSDPGSDAALGIVGTYRAQELFTAQVLEAMVRAVNEHTVGPVSGAPVEVAVVTGDATDNAQRNELRTYRDLLDGDRTIRSDSGDLTRYEGVASPAVADPHFWHPDGGVEDHPRSRYGFPEVPGALDAARQPFRSTGLDVPWLAVNGNHDQLIQGTVLPEGPWPRWQVGSEKVMTPPAGVDLRQIFVDFEAARDFGWPALRPADAVRVTPDADRRALSRGAVVREHFLGAGRPHGHGYSAENRSTGTAYYSVDIGSVRLIAMDTVNPYGGWQGSLDRVQLAWLLAEIASAGERPVVLTSHHPLETLVNDRCGDGDTRVLGDELREALLGRPQVVLWLSGHTHTHRVAPITRGDGSVAFWQVTTGSHIDWPQQSRIVELLAVDGCIVVVSTVIDSAGRLDWSDLDGPLAMAGLSRELAANDWQVRHLVGDDVDVGAGTVADRNVIVTTRWTPNVSGAGATDGRLVPARTAR